MPIVAKGPTSCACRRAVLSAGRGAVRGGLGQGRVAEVSLNAVDRHAECSVTSFTTMAE